MSTRTILEICGALVAWILLGYFYFLGWRDGFKEAAGVDSSETVSDSPHD